MPRVASTALTLSANDAVAISEEPSRATLIANLKLFGLTYAAGFLAVSLFLA